MFRLTSVGSKLCVIFLLVAFTVTSIGCGSSAPLSRQEQAKHALDAGYSHLIEGERPAALAQVKRSIELDPGLEAYLLKSQIEYGMGNTTEAYNTLDECAKLYPSDGEDDFLRAMFLSRERRSSQEIFQELTVARTDNFVEMDEEFWWEFIANEPSFAYFREQPEYAQLLQLKPPDAGVVTGCKQNKTGFEKHWWGPQIYIKEHDMKRLDDINEIIEVLAEFSALLSPAVAAIVGAALLARRIEILHKDKGCGVVINWTWVQFVPGVWASIIAYWVTSQK